MHALPCASWEGSFGTCESWFQMLTAACGCRDARRNSEISPSALCGPETLRGPPRLALAAGAPSGGTAELLNVLQLRPTRRTPAEENMTSLRNAQSVLAGSPRAQVALPHAPTPRHQARRGSATADAFFLCSSDERIRCRNSSPIPTRAFLKVRTTE